jgi:LmbE family N-acetylglucosaminyl deacetylase
MQKRQNILFVAAHPDDVADGPGGTAVLLREEYDLHVICATKGERGIPDTTNEEAAAIRETEEEAACELLGAHLTFLGKIDQEVYADRETCERVAGMMADIKPVTVFTLWPILAHPDHAAVCEIAKKALMIVHKPVELIHWEECTGIHHSRFIPEIYVDISTVLSQKKDLIRCHKSQNGPDAMVRAAVRQSILRGKEAGCRHAEGFISIQYEQHERSVLAELSP